jgi:hypothetical protein
MSNVWGSSSDIELRDTCTGDNLDTLPQNRMFSDAHAVSIRVIMTKSVPDPERSPIFQRPPTRRSPTMSLSILCCVSNYL